MSETPYLPPRKRPNVSKYDRRPWDKLENETAAAFKAFKAFLDMPAPREITALTQQLGYAKATRARVSTWASRWMWYDRAQAYDAHKSRLDEQAEYEAVRDMKRRHIEVAMAAQVKAATALSRLNPADMRAADIINYLTEAVKLERLSRGEATAIEQHNTLLTVLEQAYRDDEPTEMNGNNGSNGSRLHWELPSENGDELE